MAQVTIHLPTDILELARNCANHRHLSLSTWVNGLIRDAAVTDWPREFLEVVECGGGDLEEPDDPLPEQVEPVSSGRAFGARAQ